MGLRFNRLVLVGLVVGAAAIAACSEDFDSSIGCPVACPQQALTLTDTLIDGVVFDSTVGGFPPKGFEGTLLLSNHPDTFETRVILRFDTLPNVAIQNNAAQDSVITHVDTASLLISIAAADSLAQPTFPYTIEVYDVTEVQDTATAALLPLFRADRLLATKTFVPDTLNLRDKEILLPSAVLLQRITDRQSLRLGLRVVASQSIDLRLEAGQVALGALISLDVFGDGESPRSIVFTQSRFPEGDASSANALADFVIVAKSPPPPPVGVLRVGGFPAQRSYIQFNLPSRIIDSTVVVRATLLLHQRSFPDAPSPDREVKLYPVPLLGSARVIKDLKRMIEFIGPPGSLALDSVVMIPSQSGLREIQVGGLVRRWIGTDPEVAPRAVVLRIARDEQFADFIDFYSMEAGPLLRPKIRITYAPRSSFGLP